MKLKEVLKQAQKLVLEQKIDLNELDAIRKIEIFKFDIYYLKYNKNYLLFLSVECFDYIISGIQTLQSLIAFSEILKAFSSNKIDSDKHYQLDDFSAKLVRKEKKYFLKICFKKCNHCFFFDKVESSILASQLRKIIHSLSFIE